MEFTKTTLTSMTRAFQLLTTHEEAIKKHYGKDIQKEHQVTGWQLEDDMIMSRVRVKRRYEFIKTRLEKNNSGKWVFRTELLPRGIDEPERTWEEVTEEDLDW